ncbi:MAG: DUF1153 domain-containing protein [Neomegalonema sp.]|nr:DUF1153 domain-containing protein [Neomegalonema sp.]
MTEQNNTENSPVEFVIGPDGQQLTLDNLPPANTKRWVIRRKAEVVAAVKGRLLSLEEACAKYGISAEEFESWQKAIDRFGIQGLRTTRLQKYRAKMQ